MNEVTFGFVKPDAYRHRNSILRIINSALPIVNLKDPYYFTEKIAREHYAQLADEPFFESLVRFTVYGLRGMRTRYATPRQSPTALFVAEGENAVKVLDMITGPTDPTNARAMIPEIGLTLRALYGKGQPDNAVHRADSHQSVRRETMLHFRRDELPDYVWEMLEKEPYASDAPVGI